MSAMKSSSTTRVGFVLVALMAFTTRGVSADTTGLADNVGSKLEQLAQKDIDSKCGPGASMLVYDVCYGACDGYQTMSGDNCTCDGEPCPTWKVGESVPVTTTEVEGGKTAGSPESATDVVSVRDEVDRAKAYLKEQCGPDAGSLTNGVCYEKCSGSLSITGDTCTCNGEPCASWSVGQTGPTASVAVDTPGVNTASSAELMYYVASFIVCFALWLA